jgi:pSer/pThr/pTyr-binding forkhead associated (FHA) protein
MPFLCQIRADGATVGRWEVGDQPLVVGRGRGSDVKIQDERLSREHFAILRDGSSFVICDLNSTNGTWARGERISRMGLSDGDAIRAGRTRFLFEQGLGNVQGPATEVMW